MHLQVNATQGCICKKRITYTSSCVDVESCVWWLCHCKISILKNFIHRVLLRQINIAGVKNSMTERAVWVSVNLRKDLTAVEAMCKFNTDTLSHNFLSTLLTNFCLFIHTPADTIILAFIFSHVIAFLHIN